MNISAIAGKIGVRLSKNAPTILAASGIAAMAAGAVTAAVQGYSYKEKVLNEYAETRNHIEQVATDSEEGRLVEPYTDEEQKRDKLALYIRTGVKTIIHFSVPIALTAGGAVLVWRGHVVAARRFAALSAAYTGLKASYDDLRERVQEAPVLGPDDTREVEDAKGEKHEVRGLKSPYERYFGPENPNWDPSKQAAEAFLVANQNYFNDLLEARGHVFLNEVYDALGFPRTSAGQVVGWVKGNKDGYISFMPSRHEDIYDDEGNLYAAWILDFNVDGVVFDMLGD